jgi:hypothetical protein
MKIREVIDSEPSEQDVDTVSDFVDAIEHLKPTEALTQLKQLQQEYPTLDRILDLIPQTRLVKNVALAVDSLIAQRPQDALNHLGRAVGGHASTVATVANVGSSLKSGDYKGAAQQALNTTRAGQNLNKGLKLGQQADTMATALMDPQQTYTDLKKGIIPQQKPQPVDDLERIKELASNRC